ncbi:PAS-domain containing protein [Luteimonas sp. RIT-PG2_3]
MMPSRRRLLPIVSATVIAVAGLLVCAWLAWQWAYAREIERQTAQARQQMTLHAQSLEQLVGRYRALPQLLALDPQLRDALQGPVDAAMREQLNRRLEQASLTTRAATLTLINISGIAVAASNWRDPASNVGENYGFRPYVQQAMHEGEGRFYGVGVTTGLPGYYLSRAVRGDNGTSIGVIVIKIGLGALEYDWLRGPDTVFVSDDNGVAFLAGDDSWRYRMLRPLDPATRALLDATRQYPPQLLRPLLARTLRTLDDGTRVRALLEPRQPGQWLALDMPLPEPGWTLHLLHDAAGADAAARQSAIAAALLWLALVLLGLFVQQRMRLGSLRQRSRRELESLVQQHALELRTAQDGLVEAAQQADTGLSRRLAHLSQGIVIVDADLNLVAWNARYLELFRFPPDLIRVGRTIEDVFRHNARRGLLGPGPVEEAIQRRMGHLRSGRPHMHEREKDDGMVLEIRGNPLPDGGFVTSYTDITSYKQAARDLRSLADALERRIVERTADLEQARREAEDANRYKSRFAAAAVHDLLQPLNAARMFVSTLRNHLQDPDNRGLADSIDGALAAQDAILASLLDISRLESGTLQTDVRDLPLGPMLDTLARDAGVLAHARGLQLEHIATRAWIRSDAALLRRIVQNFLSNAVRYTAQGRIVLGCRRIGDSLRIEVHDTGPGIPPNRHKDIFEEFRRLDDGVGSAPGTGLGLAIVDRIAKLLGHRISLRSRVGHGSVFAVSVPLVRPAMAGHDAGAAAEAGRDAGAASRQAAAGESLLEGRSVGCLIDDPDGHDSTVALLQRWGCRVTSDADADGDDAAPQLLLADAHPRLRAMLARLASGAAGEVPQAILLVAPDDVDSRRLAQDEGWGVISLPVRPSALRALMTQMLLRRS